MISVQTEDFVGAVVSFVGVVRDVPSEDPLISMTLEHYPGMTERELEKIEAEARGRWPLTGALIIHRVGTLKRGDRIVLVVTASAHRKAAFEAAEFLMDYLKTRAPFWKRETRASGVHWVEAKDTDAAAAKRW
jgi:molybdopterin synthase catalytic subunit